MRRNSVRIVDTITPQGLPVFRSEKADRDGAFLECSEGRERQDIEILWRSTQRGEITKSGKSIGRKGKQIYGLQK
jgi:hypothetical protein